MREGKRKKRERERIEREDRERGERREGDRNMNASRRLVGFKGVQDLIPN